MSDPAPEPTPAPTTPTAKGIRPLYSHIIVIRDEAPTHVGGVLLPEAAKEPPATGTVIAVGEGHLSDHVTPHPSPTPTAPFPWKRHVEPLRVAVGDRVLFQSYAGTQVLHPETKQPLIIMREADILAILS